MPEDCLPGKVLPSSRPYLRQPKNATLGWSGGTLPESSEAHNPTNPPPEFNACQSRISHLQEKLPALANPSVAQSGVDVRSLCGSAKPFRREGAPGWRQLETLLRGTPARPARGAASDENPFPRHSFGRQGRERQTTLWSCY